MDKSVRIPVILAPTSEIDMFKFVIRYYRATMHAHPLKNPKGRETWETEWSLLCKGEKRFRVHNREQ